MCKGRGVPVDEIQSILQPLYELAGLTVPPSLLPSSPRVGSLPEPGPPGRATTPPVEPTGPDHAVSPPVPPSSLAVPSAASPSSPAPVNANLSSTVPVAPPAPAVPSSAIAADDPMHVDSSETQPAEETLMDVDRNGGPGPSPPDDAKSSASSKSSTDPGPNDGPKSPSVPPSRRGSVYVELPFVHIHYSDSSSSSSASSPIDCPSHSSDGDYVPSDGSHDVAPSNPNRAVPSANGDSQLPPAPRCKACVRAGVVCIPRRFRGRMCRDCQSRKVKCDFSEYTRDTGVTYASPEAFMARYGDDIYHRIDAPGELVYPKSLAEKVDDLKLGRFSLSPPPEPQPAPPPPSQPEHGSEAAPTNLIELSDDEVALVTDSALSSARPAIAPSKAKAETSGVKRKSKEPALTMPVFLPRPIGVRMSVPPYLCLPDAPSASSAP